MRQMIIAAFLLMGCNQPSEMLVHDAFTDREEQIISECLDDWERATDGDRHLEFEFGWRPVFEPSADTFEDVDGKATMILVIPGTRAHRDLVKMKSKGVGGRTRTGDVWSIQVVRQNDDRFTEEENELRFRFVVLHELGHWFGLSHTDHGLMASPAETDHGVPTSPCIDTHAIEEACNNPFIACGPNAHALCD